MSTQPEPRMVVRPTLKLVSSVSSTPSTSRKESWQ